SIEKSDYDRQLSKSWLTEFDRFIAPLRYPWHAFQMTAAYIGQMAPGSRVTIASMFQSADEMRRVQRVAYRIGLLRETHPAAGASSREIWEKDPVWQPLRELVERILVTYDWGEAFAALNLCA